MQHPKVTQTQVELWLKDPVTETLSQCLKWYQDDVKDEINTGSCLDTSNADLTLSRISQRTGQIEGLVTASAFDVLLNRYGMIEEEKHVKSV